MYLFVPSKEHLDAKLLPFAEDFGPTSFQTTRPPNSRPSWVLGPEQIPPFSSGLDIIPYHALNKKRTVPQKSQVLLSSLPKKSSPTFLGGRFSWATEKRSTPCAAEDREHSRAPKRGAAGDRGAGHPGSAGLRAHLRPGTEANRAEEPRSRWVVPTHLSLVGDWDVHLGVRAFDPWPPHFRTASTCSHFLARTLVCCSCSIGLDLIVFWEDQSIGN